jgi:hypothetical protein
MYFRIAGDRIGIVFEKIPSLLQAIEIEVFHECLSYERAFPAGNFQLATIAHQQVAIVGVNEFFYLPEIGNI